MPKSAAEVTKRWLAGVQNGTEAYREGVQAVTVAPTESAIRAIPRYVQGVQDAVADGRVERGLRRVGLEEWRRKTLEKGASRLATGARASEQQYNQFMTEFLPYLERVQQNLPPRGTLDDNLQRMVQNAREIANFKRSG